MEGGNIITEPPPNPDAHGGELAQRLATMQRGFAVMARASMASGSGVQVLGLINRALGGAIGLPPAAQPPQPATAQSAGDWGSAGDDWWQQRGWNGWGHRNGGGGNDSNRNGGGGNRDCDTQSWHSWYSHSDPSSAADGFPWPVSKSEPAHPTFGSQPLPQPPIVAQPPAAALPPAVKANPPKTRPPVAPDRPGTGGRPASGGRGNATGGRSGTARTPT